VDLTASCNLKRLLLAENCKPGPDPKEERQPKSRFLRAFILEESAKSNEVPLFQLFHG